MPPGALKRYLQFPQQQEGSAAGYEAWAKKQKEQQDAEDEEEKKSSAVQAPPAPKPAAPPGPQSMPNGFGVPSSPSADFMPVRTDVIPPPHGGADDDIKTQMGAYLTAMNQRPQMPAGGPPAAPPLPQRPQASAWEAIPQLLAGAGNVFSAGSNHPQDYLGPMMAQQQGKRDQVYNDQLAQHHNMFENQKAAYSDKLMRYSMDLREHEQKLRDIKSYIDMATEQKFLQGQKTPADTAYQGQLDWARTLYKDSQNPQDIKNLTERLVKQFPEKERAIREAGQEAAGVNQVQFEQTKGGIKRMADYFPDPVSEQIKAHVMPSGQGALGRTPVIGAPRGYRALYGIPGIGTIAAGSLDAAEAAGLADFSGGPKYGGPAVHLSAMTEKEQKEYLEEKGKKRSSFRQKLDEEQQRQSTQRYNQANPWIPQR